MGVSGRSKINGEEMGPSKNGQEPPNLEKS
jgi:hypothetical protein